MNNFLTYSENFRLAYAYYFSKIYIVFCRIRYENTKFTVSFPGKAMLKLKIFQNPARFDKLD